MPISHLMARIRNLLFPIASARLIGKFLLWVVLFCYVFFFQSSPSSVNDLNGDGQLSRLICSDRDE